MDLSIVIPLFNEDESLPELSEWIKRVVNIHGLSYEVIMVDDGSTDDSWAVIQSIAANSPAFKGIRFQRNYGKSAALNEGFKAAKEMWLLQWMQTCRILRRNSWLRRMIVEDGYDLV